MQGVILRWLSIVFALGGSIAFAQSPAPTLRQVVNTDVSPFSKFSGPVTTSSAHSAYNSEPPIPEDEDVLLKLINRTPRGFLIISASEYPNADHNRPFAAEAGRLMYNALTAMGYKELYRPLYGKDANEDNIDKALQVVATQPEDAIVIIYYVGHGIVSPLNPNDVTLGIAGKDLIDKSQGWPLYHFLAKARGQGSFQGRLVMIVDACHGGAAVLNQNVHSQLRDGTILLTAVTQDQTAERILFDDRNNVQPARCGDKQIPVGTKQATALAFFTHRALSQDWYDTDIDGSGIITFDRLKSYLGESLRNSREATPVQLCADMTPMLLDFELNVLLTYDREKVKVWNSPERRRVIVARIMAPKQPKSGERTPANLSAVLYKAGDVIVGRAQRQPGSTNMPILFSPTSLLIPDGAKSVTATFVDRDNRQIGLTIKVPVLSSSIRNTDVQISSPAPALGAERDIVKRVPAMGLEISLSQSN